MAMTAEETPADGGCISVDREVVNKQAAAKEQHLVPIYSASSQFVLSLAPIFVSASV
jgi:hypothetical protein